MKQFGFKLTFSVEAKDKSDAIQKFLDAGFYPDEQIGNDMHELTKEEIKEYGL